MPHVVIEGRIDLAAFASQFEPLVQRSGGDVLRADRVYLERGAQALLVESLVVEAGRKLPFYVRISEHARGSVTLRVDPLTHPDRSPGVRELVARIAERLLRFAPQARVVRTNLVLPSSVLQGGESG